MAASDPITRPRDALPILLYPAAARRPTYVPALSPHELFRRLAIATANRGSIDHD
jgi:hypothetical protein